jgi:hypothetical protein
VGDVFIGETMYAAAAGQPEPDRRRCAAAAGCPTSQILKSDLIGFARLYPYPT